MICRVCGEEKVNEEFNHVTNFTKYKKHKVTWCRDCQSMWLKMRMEKETQAKKKALLHKQSFDVSFQ